MLEPDDEVCLRKALCELHAVALREAARDDDLGRAPESSRKRRGICCCCCRRRRCLPKPLPSSVSALLILPALSFALGDSFRGVPERRGGHHGVERLGLGVLDERARVDDDGVGVSRILDELEAGPGEVAEEDLACCFGFGLVWKDGGGGGGE